jgi:hypothetical protein
MCDSFCILGQFCGYNTMEVNKAIIRNSMEAKGHLLREREDTDSKNETETFFILCNIQVQRNLEVSFCRILYLTQQASLDDKRLELKLRRRNENCKNTIQYRSANLELIEERSFSKKRFKVLCLLFSRSCWISKLFTDEGWYFTSLASGGIWDDRRAKCNVKFFLAFWKRVLNGLNFVLSPFYLLQKRN